MTDKEQVDDPIRPLGREEVARVFDVPPWLLGGSCPRLARLRWRLRRVLPRLVWRRP